MSLSKSGYDFTKIPFDDRTNWLRMTVGPNLSDTDFIKKLLN